MRLKYRTSKRIQRGSTGLSYRYQMGIELVSQGCHDGIIAALKGTSQGHQNVMNGISAGGAKECRALIRGGPAFALSLVLSRLEPALRAEADMGRGLHSFTVQLNECGFCGIGGAYGGCVGSV